MALILYKWFLLFLLGTGGHPIYVSVSEIEFNSKENTVDISCKIFTDDFEQTLRMKNKGKIDLLDSRKKNEMLPLVKNYILEHFRLEVNGKPLTLSFLDYERDDEGIISYIQGQFTGQPASVKIINNVLYDYKSEQMGIFHVFVNGKRQSTRLLNPEREAILNF